MQKRQPPVNKWCRKVEHSHCNPFLGQSPCVCKESGENMSRWGRSHRIWQVSQNGPTILAIGGSRPCHCFNIPAGRNFHPLPSENGWVLGGTAFCRSKVLWNPPSTLNPELLQHWVLKIFWWWKWETTCQDHIYCVKNIDLKFLMTGFLQRTNSDKNPQTETTKPFSACKLVASDKPQKNKDLVGFLLFGFFVSRVYGPKFPAFACLSHRSDIIHWHMSCAQETRGHGSIYRRGQLHIYIYIYTDRAL